MQKKKKGLKTGIFIFIAITIGSFLLIFVLDPESDFKSNFNKLWYALINMNYLYLILATFLILLSFVVCGYRIQLLCKGINKKIRFWPAVNVVTGYEFLSAVTPFSGGGQPLEIWILKRNGISIGRGLVVIYFGTATLITTFFLTGPITLIIYPEFLYGYNIPIFLIYGMLFPVYFIIFTYLSIFRPKFAKKVTHSILKFLKKLKIIKAEKFYKTLKHVITEINIFNQYVKEFFSKKKIILLIYIIFITAIAYGLRFMSLLIIGYSFGLSLDPVKIFFAQSFIFFVNYRSYLLIYSLPFGFLQLRTYSQFTTIA